MKLANQGKKKSITGSMSKQMDLSLYNLSVTGVKLWSKGCSTQNSEWNKFPTQIIRAGTSRLWETGPLNCLSTQDKKIQMISFFSLD